MEFKVIIDAIIGIIPNAVTALIGQNSYVRKKGMYIFIKKKKKRTFLRKFLKLKRFVYIPLTLLSGLIFLSANL